MKIDDTEGVLHTYSMLLCKIFDVIGIGNFPARLRNAGLISPHLVLLPSDHFLSHNDCVKTFLRRQSECLTVSVEVSTSSVPEKTLDRRDCALCWGHSEARRGSTSYLPSARAVAVTCIVNMVVFEQTFSEWFARAHSGSALPRGGPFVGFSATETRRRLWKAINCTNHLKRQPMLVSALKCSL
jgi:hypothetical protein